MPRKKKIENTKVVGNKINLDNFNYYGLDHEQVKKKFAGELTYIGTFCIKDEYTPRAFYFNAKPDREKLHKDYMTLQSDGGSASGASKWYVSGIDKDKLEEYRYQAGLRCTACDDVIYSIMRHDYHPCKCGKTFIDGGRDYVRSSIGNCKGVMIDLLTGEYKEE